jgi:hypothetical protein
MFSRRLSVALILVTALSFGAPASYAQRAKPPELVQLERDVALKIAHARGIGYPDHARREKLAGAERENFAAQRAIAGGDYDTAVNRLLQAKVLLRDLGL